MKATASGSTGGWVSWPCEWCLAQGGVGGDAVAQEVAGGGDHGVDGAGHCGVLVRVAELGCLGFGLWC